MIGVRVGGNAELPPLTSTDNLNSQTQETLDMQLLMLTLAVILGSISVAASAADVEFETQPKLFDEPAAAEAVSLFTYDSPLYEGLWPMTIEAFKRSDWDKDREVFTFNIAFSR